MLDAVDKAIISLLSGDIPLCREPYKVLSEGLNISEEELLARLNKMKDAGALKRIACIIRHYRTPYTCNGMAVWSVPEGKKEEVSELMKSVANTSHVYERQTVEGWPYNFFCMVHGRSKQEVETLIKEVAEGIGITDFAVLYTTYEWKKTSPNPSIFFS